MIGSNSSDPSAWKPCPRCAFGASLNARACAGCGYFFADVAPQDIRNWITTHLRKAVDLHPEWGETELQVYLEGHLLHDEGLIRAIEKDEDLAAGLSAHPSLIQELAQLLKRLKEYLLGEEHVDAERKLRWAVLGALEEARPGSFPYAGVGRSSPRKAR